MRHLSIAQDLLMILKWQGKQSNFRRPFEAFSKPLEPSLFLMWKVHFFRFPRNHASISAQLSRKQYSLVSDLACGKLEQNSSQINLPHPVLSISSLFHRSLDVPRTCDDERSLDFVHTKNHFWMDYDAKMSRPRLYFTRRSQNTRGIYTRAIQQSY